jgi:hypothetical protein
MTHTFTTTGDVGPNHQLLVELPPNIPVGPVRVTITLESSVVPKIRTFGDLLGSEVFGMYRDRTDLPTSEEEFREWRRKAWDGDQE